MKFSRSGAYSDQPLTVSCGQCVGCRLERSRQWAARIMGEAQLHKANSFITLTYDNENLPDDHSLNVKHWQDFAKRLRKRKGKFRFYHAGEYGDKKGRPHYHAAIFGMDFLSDRKYYTTTKQGHTLYTSKSLNAIWGQGEVWIGDLSFESAAYIARYIMKKITGDSAEFHYRRWMPGTGEEYLLKPEYNTMSRRPGIGKAWITKFMSDVYPSDELIVNGHPTRPPKFYDQQLEKLEPITHRRIKVRRKKEGNRHLEEQSYDRLAVREQIKLDRIKTLKRGL